MPSSRTVGRISSSGSRLHSEYSVWRAAIGWRVPGDFTFDYEDVKFLVVEAFSDIGKLPEEAVKIIGKRSILSMSNYRRIEELWPPPQKGWTPPSGGSNGFGS
jgi:hypothetical protein